MPIIKGIIFTEKDRKLGYKNIKELFDSLSENKKTNLMFFMMKRLPLNKWITYQDIADTFGVNKTNVNKYVRNLVDVGIAEKTSTRPIKFRLLVRTLPKKRYADELGISVRDRDFTTRKGTQRGKGRGVKRPPLKK